MILSRKYLIDYKKTLVLSDLQREILVGILLGDATIPSQKGNSSHNVKWEQKVSKKEYVDHLYYNFKDWVGTAPVIRNIKGGGAQDRQSVWFRTYRHPAFTYYRHLFYKKGEGNDLTLRKRVPGNIGDLLTSRSLAYWFMDDGHKDAVHKIDAISTHSFSYNEHLVLVDLVLRKFNLKARVHKDEDKFRLYIMRQSVGDFTKLIEPFMVDCMRYKLL